MVLPFYLLRVGPMVVERSLSYILLLGKNYVMFPRVIQQSIQYVIRGIISNQWMVKTYPSQLYARIHVPVHHLLSIT